MRDTLFKIPVLLSLWILLGSFQSETVRAEEKSLPPLRVGMELSYPPFEMTDEKGEPAGVSVELAKALGASLGRSVKINNIPFDGLIPALKTGQLDCLISSITATEQRAQVVDFSEPYLKTGLALLLSSRSRVSSVSDLAASGKLIAVKKGTTGHLYATTHFPSNQVLVLDKESSAVLEVIQGKAEAFIYDQLSIYHHAQNNPTTTKALLNSFQAESWAVAVRKGDKTLLSQVNAFIADFRAKGGFETLGDRYLAGPKAAFKEQGIPFLF